MQLSAIKFHTENNISLFSDTFFSVHVVEWSVSQYHKTERMLKMERTITSKSAAGERDIGILRGAILFAGGLLLGLCRLFGYPAPFAAAGVGIFGGIECVFVFVGAAVGYFINAGASVTAAYIAAMGIIALTRLIIGLIPGASRTVISRLVLSAAAGVCVFFANIFGANGVYDIFISAAFAVISGVYLYCADKLHRAGIRVMTGKRQTGISAALSVLFVLLTAALTSLNIGVLNVGVFVSSLAILCASEIKTSAGAAVCAVLSSAGIAAGNADLTASCILLSVTAPVIMLFDRYGRITRACAFIATIGGGMLITGITPAGGIAALSCAGAAALFMAVPERFSPFSALIGRARIVSSPAPFAAFGKRLGNMSSAVEEMRNAVIRTADALEKENLNDISWVYTKAADSVCGNCRGNMTCWGQMYNDTADIMNKAVGMLKTGGFVNESALDGHLLSVCTRRSELAAALNKQYAVYCSAVGNARKVSEMRNVLTSQLGATETMLRKMSEELERNDAFDEYASAEAEKVFAEAGCRDVSVIALIIEDRMCIDAYGQGLPDISREELADRLAFALHKVFDLPVVSECGGKVHITVSERSACDIQTAVFSKNKQGRRTSGDCAECFNDGRGSAYLILSDGMGSGSRARIDSAFSCSMLIKLLKAGIDPGPALEMINTSLMVKSPDESFATLDLCRIDLNTGDVTLRKAGGAAAYIRCGDTFAEIKEGGLPLGVGFGTEMTEKRFRLSEGDIIILTSDGANIDKQWLEKIVMRDRHPDIEKIITTVGEALRLSAEKGCDDDMTVIGAKIIR